MPLTQKLWSCEKSIIKLVCTAIFTTVQKFGVWIQDLFDQNHRKKKIYTQNLILV